MFYQVFHLIDHVENDYKLPTTIIKANNICRNIAKNYDKCQCFKIIELDDNCKYVGERWVECFPNGKLSVSHKNSI